MTTLAILMFMFFVYLSLDSRFDYQTKRHDHLLKRLDAIERHLFDGKTLAEKERGK